MERETAYYRRKFNTALEPIKVMLVNKKRTLTLVTWLAYVQKTKARVISRPSEYLGEALPPEELTNEIVDSLFSDFLKREA
ncbi:MAG TPA: hypothetical protein VK508_21785 [Cyclobacteriaceae bacterium]|nr:hypothetical protein [Cyclobacteriaceae bacterium]